MYRYLIQSVFVVLFSVGALIAPRPASAAYTDVIAVTCTNSPVHVADFVTCARAFEIKNGKTGLLIVVSPTAALSALVQSTGTYTLSCSGIFCLYSGGTLTPVNMDGTPLTLDSQLTAVDQTLFAQMRAASILSKPIPINPDYGGSYINNDALAEDTSSGISNYLYVQNLVNPNNVPVGTVVTVKWSDGTTAQFVRVTTSGSIQWAYKPGTAKNSNGQPINPDGSLVTNPATSGTGSGVANPVVTPSPGYDWSISVNPLPFCSAEVDVDDEDGNLLLGSIGFFPCP
jgi:hypothetical protein